MSKKEIVPDVPDKTKIEEGTWSSIWKALFEKQSTFLSCCAAPAGADAEEVVIDDKAIKKKIDDKVIKKKEETKLRELMGTPTKVSVEEITKVDEKSCSVQIPVVGSRFQAFVEGRKVIVSFPGVHGAGWNCLVKNAIFEDNGLATSCVFLPDKKAKGYGKHLKFVNGKHHGSATRCHCTYLYKDDMDKAKGHGCAWFSIWATITCKAPRRHFYECRVGVHSDPEA